MDRPNPLFQRRSSFEERAEALQCLCDGFAKFLGYQGWPITVLREKPEEIPMYEKLAFIDETSTPAVVSTYWRYEEPGHPPMIDSYQDLPSFIRGFFCYEIERAGRSGAIKIPGFPPAPGADIKDVAELYFQALDAENEALNKEIDALIATPELQELERIIWS
jgi:hypothetical protein